ncbi:LysM peptidoglycan-binding domain-containing protein [Umezawaea sp. Da 62-37]|uniref:LysM peptidoglycan-binding domain-containing protein n=1 Tax=Umezawaea sp. Da 62-37 TaxID=3075927 RepID=UPI0028F733A3|nr:LysM peptidoglycan-binding domain-containing protein [Umezawaea sp. Da 62-37]WNV85967.1 LysM peptidoglycan-binding domain-containing protein [Umezawaea sp. Da 62-37]
MDTLQAGQNLAVGQQLDSENGYVLALQDDGNLVLKDGGDVVWATGTNGSGATSATLQDDGNFVLYTASGNVAWASDSGGNPGSRLVLQNDRNLVVYSGNGSSTWASGTNTDNPRPTPTQAAPEAAPVEQAAPAPAAPAEQHWTVDPGDTLWAIAEKVYGDGNQYQRIADANGISNPDLISVGQDLVIPA